MGAEIADSTDRNGKNAIDLDPEVGVVFTKIGLNESVWRF